VLSNRGRRDGTGFFSVVPPAGRAGVGAEERRRPTWRPRLPLEKLNRRLSAILHFFAAHIFRECQWRYSRAMRLWALTDEAVLASVQRSDARRPCSRYDRV
jgi:uncharacterized membrane protein